MNSAATAEAEIEQDAEFGAAPNLTETEKKAVDLFGQFQAAERDRLSVGIAFGHSVVALRDEIKAKHSRDFMARLKELGISQEKARYWMAKAEKKPTDRHKTDSDADAQERETDTQGSVVLDWESVLDHLEAVKNEVYMLRKARQAGSDVLAGPLASLADLLGYTVVKKGEQ
jgi:hypothetical protein